jgi:hypothetical protein
MHIQHIESIQEIFLEPPPSTIQTYLNTSTNQYKVMLTSTKGLFFSINTAVGSFSKL